MGRGLARRTTSPNGEIGTEELNGSQIVLGILGVLLYGVAALGYLRLYQRRRLKFVLAVTFAFALLAEAMVVIAFAENWHISWWEWHTLMLAAFATISLAARSQRHEERFSPLYLDETLAGVKEASVSSRIWMGTRLSRERNGSAAAARMLNTDFVGEARSAHGGVRGRCARDDRRRTDGDLQQGRRST